MMEANNSNSEFSDKHKLTKNDNSNEPKVIITNGSGTGGGGNSPKNIPSVSNNTNINFPPSLENLYILHSFHRLKNELYKCFLVCIVFYCFIEGWNLVQGLNIGESVEIPVDTSSSSNIRQDHNNPVKETHYFGRTFNILHRNDKLPEREEINSIVEEDYDSTDTSRSDSNHSFIPYILIPLNFLLSLYSLFLLFLLQFRSKVLPYLPQLSSIDSSQLLITHLPLLFLTTSITLLSIHTCITSHHNSHPLLFGWVLLFTFYLWITVPITTEVIPVIYGFGCSLLAWGGGYGYYSYKYLYYYHEELGKLPTIITLLITTNLIGLLVYHLNDKKQRRAFLDTRQSLEMKLVVEEQADEQERLLLSVLPSHLALRMRQDLGSTMTPSQQFKKIYMSRHEPVSILYADIVGFTAISSTYSASELVKILNELFARFDKLAEKYSQTRIKILGDCYYCICGAPEQRDDHAALCVHMGLSMVKAIKYVRETTNSPVDMRVGIHTGAILAGVLGQRQWQFDIYSKDVELANKMESAGMPGRVHISEKTLSYCNGDFEVEPGGGEKREEILKIAGIKTFFIVKVLKEFKSSNAENKNDGNTIVVDDELPSVDLNSSVVNPANDDTESNAEFESYRLKRLKEELMEKRDGNNDLTRSTHWLTLKFTNPTLELNYISSHREPYTILISSTTVVTVFVVGLCNNLWVNNGSNWALGWVVMACGVGGAIGVVFGLEYFNTRTCGKRDETSGDGETGTSKILNSPLFFRRLFTIALTGIYLTTLLTYSLPDCVPLQTKCNNMSTDEIKSFITTRPMDVDPPLVLPSIKDNFPTHLITCPYPSIYAIFAALLLASFTLLTSLGSIFKTICILITIITLMLVIGVGKVLDCEEKLSGAGSLMKQIIVYLCVVFIGFGILCRRLEKSSRILYLWKNEVEQQRDQASTLRQKNEALVYNILPPHVAAHFLGSKRRMKHEELYSQSYSEVGILFASMPNFSDFYSEESVNNQGLECLRFLNEVISDFDALLEVEKYDGVICKIKTISSTYMAASGLTPGKEAKPSDPLSIRWTHLSLLVEFALDLKLTLTSINEQSFNHFVLKMGINHGPITAGVIGARKPHYDIWGNSVNVASRMESTGKAGCIQVTEETYRILSLYGYKFEQRGLVNVKGKGQLMTYYLIGKMDESEKMKSGELDSETSEVIAAARANRVVETSNPLE